MADFSRIGWGQVEPNHLSAQKTGQIWAQLPADNAVFGTGATPEAQAETAILENGQFVKYDYATNKVNLSGDGDWVMVFNEIKLYDERRQAYKNFVYAAKDFTDKTMYPRVIKINVGDIFTTNTFGKGAGADATVTVTGWTPAQGDDITVDTATGYLKAGTPAAGSNAPHFQVAKVYTLADGQAALKLQRIA